MTKNNNLHSARKAKNDEFYTQFSDIEKEMVHYRNFFRGKVVYCNCDSLESNFFKYFFLNFKFLGLKKLICTSYNENGHGTFFETDCGDENNNSIVDGDEVKATELEGNGDFRSQECIDILKTADVVVTNPPFSLFHEYVDQLMEYEKKFLIIGNQNAITYKEIFPLIKNNELWFGPSIGSGDRIFTVPDSYELRANVSGIDENGKKFVRVNGVRWFTNIDHNKRRLPLDLYKKYSPEEYPHYDNYDAINVDKTADIPMDFDGVMGVPITFLDKYCPEQFEIVGGFNGYKECNLEHSLLCGNRTEYYDNKGNLKTWTGPTVNKKTKYYRLLIKNRT